MSELYDDALLGWARDERRAGHLNDATHRATAHNPLCGDRVTLALRVVGDRVTDVAFSTEGCAIVRAAAALVADLVVDRPLEHLDDLRADASRAITGDQPSEPALAPLRALAAYPARARCGQLPWDALTAAVASPVSPASDAS